MFALIRPLADHFCVPGEYLPTNSPKETHMQAKPKDRFIRIRKHPRERPPHHR